MRCRTIAWLTVVWPAALLVNGQTPSEPQLASLGQSQPAATPNTNSGASLTAAASSPTPTQTVPYGMPQSMASARSVQPQYSGHQSVGGGAPQVQQSGDGGGVPQLSVADILALRRAVQQSQLLSRSGVLAPSATSLNRGGLGYGSGGLLGQFGASQFPTGGNLPQFHDPYHASGSAPAGAHLPPPPPIGNKNSISTRFRSFMNSLFFRRSTAASPAFYQGGSSPYGIPGASGAAASPFSPAGSGYHVGHHHGFASKIFPGSAAPYNPQTPGGGFPQASGSVKSSIVPQSPVASKPTGYQASASSLLPTVQKSPVLPVPASSISSTGSSGHSQISQSPSSSAGTFYPSAATAPGPSFDKTQFSSLYGSNGFTAKAGPIGSSHPAKSSKSLKSQSSSSMETAESQLSPFMPVVAPPQHKSKSHGKMKASITTVSAADAIRPSNHQSNEDNRANSAAQVVTVQTSTHSVSSSDSSSSSSTESSDSNEGGVRK